MFKEGELIKYMMPLDADYSIGVITELKKGRAVVKLKSYHELGGNGMVTKMKQEIEELHIKRKGE